MENFLSLTVLIIILGTCNVNGQTTNAFDFLFDANSDGRTGGYELRAWNGVDTTLATLSSSNFIGFYGHDSLITIYGTEQLRLTDVYSVGQDGRYIKGWLRARSIQVPYLYSEWAESEFFKTDDLTPPRRLYLAGGGSGKLRYKAGAMGVLK